ncbi:MAG: Ig domain-containing protein, partial [Eubacterium sp.]|nr:Ig domain-containing protein [Eubacterium sp.]
CKSNKSLTVSYLINVVNKNAKYSTVVTLSPKIKYMNVGKYFKVKRKVTDANNGNKKLKWKSTNTRVATVNSKGRVKSKKVGTTYIVATCQDGSKAKGRMKVVVRNQVTKISLNKTTANLLVGKTTRLRVIYTPRNATVKGVTWKSSDPAIATVNGGKVIAVATGIVKITATSKDTTGKKASCWVTVSEPQPVTNFTITDAQITVAKGKSVNCGITPNPINATDSIRYFSDNPSVASVNSRGKITTHRVGQASIYARASNGVEGRVDVTVVDLNRKAVTLRQYDTEQLMVNQISEGVTWYSADPNIAKVDENGLVTGRLPGTTIIYANVDGVKLGCRVTVTKIR